MLPSSATKSSYLLSRSIFLFANLLLISQTRAYSFSFYKRFQTSFKPVSLMTNPFLSTVNPKSLGYRNQILKMSTNSGGGVDNPMNPNIYTEKAWESIGKLPAYADKYSVQYVEASLLLKSLIDDGPNGLTQRILSKCNINVNTLDKNLDDYLKKQPKVVGGVENKVMGRTMSEAFTKAGSLRREYGDQFISVEHLLLACADTDGITKKLFTDLGIKYSQLKDAVNLIRGQNKVDSRNPENSYEALKKYAR